MTMPCRAALLAVACLTVCAGLPGPACGASLWAEYGEFSSWTDALPPTPQGDGHLGLLESDAPVQLRFAVPEEPAVGYWLRLGNIVGFSGKGGSYQLILRRDAQDGPVIHEGPVVADGDQWNATNRDPIDITFALTAGDRARGYVDVYATAVVEGDGWTVYRNGAGRPIGASHAVLSPELQARMQTAGALRDRQVSLLPIPREITLGDGELRLTEGTAIVYAQGAPASLAHAGQELAALIRERTGLDLSVGPVQAPAAGDIALGIAGVTAWPEPAAGQQQGKEAYGLTVDADGARVVGTDEAGAFYGAMTLGQAARVLDAGPSVAHMHVNDRPAFVYRIIQYDIARGQTVDVDYVKRMIRELARCKTNALLFYMEDDFRFRKYPFLGREGTFTHEKAAELSEYAASYHMQLIPQFESLGHAGAVLGHEELAHLREAGGSWVFCTNEPRTWEFLDDVFGELVEAFPTSEFIHTGGDEFEFGFGKCDRCRAQVDEEGMGGLYAEHMNRLNQLVKKRGKTMMFWPSHHGPTPELSNMTLQYQDRLEKDCIPTEWIYHGPPEYPTIQQYQEAGFLDVHCCPAVESYSRVWPDYTTTLRAVRGFYRAGEARGCGGAYCTTWEFMHGALVENSWYGLIFAAECSWSPASTTAEEFDRRFADQWWGIRGDDVTGRMADTMVFPVPRGGPAGLWYWGRAVSEVLWTAPDRVMRQFALKQKEYAEAAPALVQLSQAARRRAEAFSQRAGRNELTFRAAMLAFDMMHYAGSKPVVFGEATEDYLAAGDLLAQDPQGAAARVARVAEALGGLGAMAAEVKTGYGYFVRNCGAFAGDESRLEGQSEQLARFSADLAQLAADVAAGKVDRLPPGDTFGLLQGMYEKIGEWTPENVSQDGATLTFDVTGRLPADGAFDVEWEYDRGAHGLNIRATKLLRDGEPIAEDVHGGWAGSGSSGTVYRFEAGPIAAEGKYEIQGEVASSGGSDSRGTVWLTHRGR